jgi:hypothetical protein
MILPSGEAVAAPDYTIIPIERLADVLAETLGTRLLPNERRSFQFTPRSLDDGIIRDPRDPRFTPDITRSGPTLNSYYDD